MGAYAKFCQFHIYKLWLVNLLIYTFYLIICGRIWQPDLVGLVGATH